MESLQKHFGECGLTGLSTRVGDLMIVMLKYDSLGVTVGPGDAQIITPIITYRMHIGLHVDQIL